MAVVLVVGVGIDFLVLLLVLECFLGVVGGGVGGVLLVMMVVLVLMLVTLPSKEVGINVLERDDTGYRLARWADN